jgi:hypothetical protein
MYTRHTSTSLKELADLRLIKKLWELCLYGLELD